MSKFKFRTWQKNQNIMHYFGLLDIHAGGAVVYCANREEEKECGHVANIDNFGDHSPIMLYTGIKDKNGKEIYEGDIVDTSYGIRIVEFGEFDNEYEYEAEYGIGFYLKDILPLSDEQYKNDKIGYVITLEKNLAENMNIIGNIYESPELIS